MKRSYLPKLAIGVGLLLALFWMIGSGDVYSALLRMNPWFLVPLIVLSIVRIAVASLNVQLFVNPLKRIPVRTFFTHYLYSWIAGLILPGKVGEFSISYFLTEEKIRLGDSMAVIVLDKITSFLVASIVASFGFFLFFPFSQAVLLAGSVLALWVIVPIFFSSWGRSLFRRLLTDKHEKKFAGFSATFFSFVQHQRGRIGVNILVTILVLGIHTFIMFLTFLSFGQIIPFWTLFTIAAMVTVASFIPITFNGLGIREGAYVFLLGLQGVAPSVVASASIVNLAVNYGIAAAVWLGLLAQRKSIFRTNPF